MASIVGLQGELRAFLLFFLYIHVYFFNVTLENASVFTWNHRSDNERQEMIQHLWSTPVQRLINNAVFAVCEPVRAFGDELTSGQRIEFCWTMI